jgi:hypothetical protein
MSESIIVHKRIVQLRKSIEHYKKTSQIIPIEWIKSFRISRYEFLSI